MRDFELLTWPKIIDFVRKVRKWQKGLSMNNAECVLQFTLC